MLDTRIRESLNSAHDALIRRGELLSIERAKAGYALFRERFGPERLKSLDGEALLQAMHTHGNKDSLVYWLEFKNDEEFPSPMFGGIGGGSAHKFRLFRRKDTGLWVKGSAQKEQEVTLDEAIAIARSHREQLIAGVDALGQMPANGSDAQYESLQSEMSQRAPDLFEAGWAHKYWSLIHPDKIDDYHNERYQRFHLIRLLQDPPHGTGLFICAGRFVQLAAETGWPINQLSSIINERNGRPVRYWRIGTRVADEPTWDEMRDGGYVAIGWEDVGDFNQFREAEDVREAIRQALERAYPNNASVTSRHAGELRAFFSEIAEGDIVVAADGESVLGLGKMKGPYTFDRSPPTRAPHRRQVDWISTETWKLPATDGLRSTVRELKKHEQNLLEIERRLLDGVKQAPASAKPTVPSRTSRMDGIPGRVQAILERKGQAILFGPPGTGKTFWARLIAHDLSALDAFGKLFADLDTGEKAQIVGDRTASGFVRMCTFHPSYGYEDFLEGYRPHATTAGHLAFERRDGIFKRLCDDARRRPERLFFLLIDEINRGDIPRIFGELLTLIEADKRALEVQLPLSGQLFSVPRNVRLIGTMNTADRSIALLDTALRRRFGFVELMPDIAALGNASAGGSVPLGPWLSSLNERLRTSLGRDARNLQVGHAYLMEGGKPVTDFNRFVRVLADDIIPLLEEYCYEDYAALAKILGERLVDEGRQRVREELLAPNRHDDLVQALLVMSPEMVTAPEATASPSDTSVEDEAEAS